MEVRDIVGESAPTPDKGIICLLGPNHLNQNQGDRQNLKWLTGGGNTTLQSSPSDDQGGININGELRQVGVSNGLEYYNPNPWARILGRANETDIENDLKINNP